MFASELSGCGFEFCLCYLKRFWTTNHSTKLQNEVTNLGISTEHNYLDVKYIFHNPIENVIDKYKNRPSIIAANKHMEGADSLFWFQTVTQDKIAELIANLDTKKAAHSTDISNKLIKKFVCLVLKYEAIYEDAFKKAEIRSLYKKDVRTGESITNPLVSL